MDKLKPSRKVVHRVGHVVLKHVVEACVGPDQKIRVEFVVLLRLFKQIHLGKHDYVVVLKRHLRVLSPWICFILLILMPHPLHVRVIPQISELIELSEHEDRVVRGAPLPNELFELLRRRR